MNKKIDYSYLTVFAVLMYFSQTISAQKSLKKEFVLKGKIVGMETGLVHLEYSNSIKIYKIDSCFLKNGEFEFTGFIDEPTFATFYGKVKPRSLDDPDITDVVLEPSRMKAYLKSGDFKNAKIIGSKSQTEYKLYYYNRIGVVKKWSKLFEGLDRARLNSDTATVRKIIEEQFPLYKKETSEVDINFIKKFPNSYVSAFVLVMQKSLLATDSLKVLYSELSNAIQKSVNGGIVNEFIKNAEKLAIGMPAPHFTKEDMNGNIISLNDFKGKYVLLDFWASWCVPCREENPNLKKAYSMYYDKGFNIIGISLDQPSFKDAWLKAIKTDALPWMQLALDGDVVKQYNIQQIPSSYLIDPNGKIVGKDLRGEELEKKLSEIIKR
ncbi:MAG: AhpC/TSA family protein [Ferruginibacter sp.]|nr:AhpC/TSA family protein [Ferruginibacter sp.]